MKKHNTNFLNQFKRIKTLGFALFATIIVLSFSSNPPNGKTGGPGEGACSEPGCHTGSGAGLDGDISFSGLPSSITPGTTYPITVTLTNPNGAANRAGFQWVALNSNNLNAGSISNNSTVTGQNTTITMQAGRTYHEHAGSTTFSGTSLSWTADWTAPSSPSGDVITFYGVGNIANGSGSGGDRIVFTNTSGTLSSSGPTLTASITNDNPVTCFGDSDGSATVMASGGTPGYNYAWDNGETTATATALNAGMHTVTVTDNTAATSSASVMITTPSDITISEIQHIDVSCNGVNDGSSEVMATGGNGGFSYQWSNGQSGAILSGVAGGLYSVVVTDVQGCSKTQNVTIQEPTAVVVSVINSQNESCLNDNDGSITVNATGGAFGYNYAWSNGFSGNSINNLSPGTYQVTVTDANNCTAETSATILSGSNLGISISNTQNPSCFGATDGSLTVNATGSSGYTYAWSNGATTAINSGIGAGNYAVTVTDTNGCSKFLNTGLAAPGQVMISTLSTSNVSCNGEFDGSINITTSGGIGNLVSTWSNGILGNNLSSLSAGTYTVTVSDANSCSNSMSFIITEPGVFTAQHTNNQNPTCNGFSDGFSSIITNGGTAPFNYQWSNGTSDFFDDSLSAGSYSVLVTDANGCQATSNVTLTEPDPIISNINSTNETIAGANDGTASINPTGGTGMLNALWSNGTLGNSITGLSPGQYSVTITDSNNCTSSETVAVSSGDCILMASATIDSVSCFSGNDGIISIDTSNVTGAVSYLWSHQGIGTNIADTLSSGNYSVTITDDLLCEVILSDLIVGEPDSLSLGFEILSNPICQGETTGIISVNIMGGTAPYMYTWSTGEANDTLMNLGTGIYYVTVSDQNNCMITDSIVLNNVDNLAPELLLMDFELAIDSMGVLPSYDETNFNLGTSDNCGIAGFNFTDVGVDCSGIGTYDIIVDAFDINGNVSTDTIQLTIVDNIAPIVDCINDVTITGCDPIIFDIPVMDNCAVVDTSISSSFPTEESFPIGISTLTYTFTDASGNSSFCTFDVTVESTLDATAVVTNPSCFNFSDGLLELDIEGGNAPYNISYNTPIDTMFLAAGEYEAYVTDATGCIVVIPFEVSNPPILVVADAILTDPQTGSSNDGSIDILVEGGTGTYTFQWLLDGQVISTEEDLVNVGPGTYQVAVRDENDCVYLSLNYDLESVVGVNDLEFLQSFKVFPNPTSEYIEISFEDQSTKSLVASLYNNQGQLIITNVNLESGDIIALDQVTNGIYILELSDGKDSIYRKISVLK